ncbi:MAG: hypothetical protein CMM87_06200 [Rickettsiales bacterium]|nr:hypothetical protein [Rickettsiales bacterium]|tara:strand:- start:8172 stop:8594 length:423 start_codon:yes stop_codon:yes gene_type:complete
MQKLVMSDLIEVTADTGVTGRIEPTIEVNSGDASFSYSFDFSTISGLSQINSASIVNSKSRILYYGGSNWSNRGFTKFGILGVKTDIVEIDNSDLKVFVNGRIQMLPVYLQNRANDTTRLIDSNAWNNLYLSFYIAAIGE